MIPEITTAILTPPVNQRPPFTEKQPAGINAIATPGTTETDEPASQMSTNVPMEVTNVHHTRHVLTFRTGIPVNVSMGMLEMDIFAPFQLTNVPKELTIATFTPNVLICQMDTNANATLQR